MKRMRTIEEGWRLRRQDVEEVPIPGVYKGADTVLYKKEKSHEPLEGRIGGLLSAPGQDEFLFGLDHNYHLHKKLA